VTDYKKPIFPHPIDPFHLDLVRSLDEQSSDLDSILNGGLLFGTNFDAVMISVTSNATPDTEDTVAHTLGKAPTGYIVYYKDKAGDIYDGGTTWTTSSIYLKCSVASVTYKIIVF